MDERIHNSKVKKEGIGRGTENTTYAQFDFNISVSVNNL
jgi:hypothetical protein